MADGETLGEPDASKGCTSRFGGEGLVCLGNQDPASYPTRATGEPLDPDATTRNAERSKGEKRELASRMLGKLARPVRQVRGWKRAARVVPRQPPILLRLSVRKMTGILVY